MSAFYSHATNLDWCPEFVYCEKHHGGSKDSKYVLAHCAAQKNGRKLFNGLPGSCTPKDSGECIICHPDLD